MSSSNFVNVIEGNLSLNYPESPIYRERTGFVTSETRRTVTPERPTRQTILIPNYPDSPVATQELRGTRRIPRAVTPERRTFQYVPVFSSYYEDEEHFVHVIGVFDSQISACHATIKWMIENDRGIDLESEAWGDNDYSPEEAIGMLTRNTINWDNVEAYANRFGNGYYNQPRGWYIQLQIF